MPTRRAVQDHAGMLTHVVQADTTDPAGDARSSAPATSATAIVAIGTDIEASILTTSVLADLERPADRRQGDHAGAREDPRAGRRPPRRVPRARHGRAGRRTPSRAGRSTTSSSTPASRSSRRRRRARSSARRSPQAEVRRRYGITVVCIKPAGRNVHVRDAGHGREGGRHPRRRRRDEARRGIQRASLARVVLPLGRVGDDADVDPGERPDESHDERPAQHLLRSRRPSGVPMKT